MVISQILTRTDGGTPVRVSGAGPTLILVHGVLMDHRMWFHQVEALSEHYRVCCMDMLGHGDAPDPAGERTLDDFVRQVHEVVEQFSDSGKPLLCGFSMGGLVAQAYAIRYSHHLSGLMLLNTVHDRTSEEAERVVERYERNLSHGIENAIESGIRRWFEKIDPERHAQLIDNVITWMRDGDFTAKCKAHRVFATSDSEITGKLDAISCPALIMTGEDDSGSTPAMTKKMANQISDSEYHILDGQHHMMPVFDADRVNRILLDFLSKRILQEK